MNGDYEKPGECDAVKKWTIKKSSTAKILLCGANRASRNKCGINFSPNVSHKRSNLGLSVPIAIGRVIYSNFFYKKKLPFSE